ncbi:DUF3795 domain-containing protein [Patescibacteria group bacterium]|nr:DUF3795 domain-containing protein [Patescibacteria group bacterium]
MNCRLCLAYVRENNKCHGCNGVNKLKIKGCRTCLITKCVKSKKNHYCFECNTFPCARMKHLDKRYSTKYEMSMLENLAYIKKHGIGKFVARENKRWIKGDKVYCVHHHKYY